MSKISSLFYHTFCFFCFVLGFSFHSLFPSFHLISPPVIFVRLLFSSANDCFWKRHLLSLASRKGNPFLMRWLISRSLLHHLISFCVSALQPLLNFKRSYSYASVLSFSVQNPSASVDLAFSGWSHSRIPSGTLRELWTWEDTYGFAGGASSLWMALWCVSSH